MAGHVSAPRSPDFPAVSCPIPRRRLLPKTAPLLCIFHGPSFSTAKRLLLASQPPLSGPCLSSCLSSNPALFLFVVLFFSLSHGLWFSYFLGKSHPSKRQPEGVVFFRAQFKQITGQSLSGSRWSPLVGEASHLPESFIYLLWDSVFWVLQGAEGRVPGNMGVE